MTLPSLLEAPMSQLISFLGILDAAGLTEEAMNAITTDPDMANDWLQALFDANPTHFPWRHLELPEDLPAHAIRSCLLRLNPSCEDTTLDYYGQPVNFRRVVATLNEEQVTVLCLEMEFYECNPVHHAPLSSKRRRAAEHEVQQAMHDAIEFNRAATERRADPSWRSWPVGRLDFSERTAGCLQRANILIVGDLCDWTEDDLLMLANFGLPCLDEVIAKLRSCGLRLRSRD